LASHHTKDKGDLGVVMVIADLVRHGVDVYVPLSEHQPSDLIAADRRAVPLNFCKNPQAMQPF